jgi:hypothetical protein
VLLRAPRPVLAIGHPGHELRAHGWVERERPLVLVLTDGAGSTGRSRLESTAALLDGLGAPRGAVFGRMPDVAFYDALLAGETALFTALAGEIADILVAEGAEVVVGDALEGYNPAHDVCRMLLDAAVVEASVRVGRPVANYDFLLAGAPGVEGPGGFEFVLDDAALVRKRDAALAYGAMRSEVEPALSRYGLEAFRVERFRRVGVPAWTPAELPPSYERHGEARVASGRYRRVIRWTEHVAPLAEALASALTPVP